MAAAAAEHDDGRGMAAEDEDAATAEEEDDDGGGVARDGSGGRRTAEANDGSVGCVEEEMAAWRLLWKHGQRGSTMWGGVFFTAIP